MPTDQTATVTVIRPSVVHYPSCDREVYGRAVVYLMEGPAEDITRDNVLAYASALRSGTVREFGKQFTCDCLRLRILNTEGQLDRARKAWEASTTDDNADRVAFLRAELSRLRGMA